MRDYAVELEKRVAFIQDVLSKSGAKGIVFGNSGGKDSALVGILCKKACDNTVGIMMPRWRSSLALKIAPLTSPRRSRRWSRRSVR